MRKATGMTFLDSVERAHYGDTRYCLIQIPGYAPKRVSWLGSWLNWFLRLLRLYLVLECKRIRMLEQNWTGNHLTSRFG
jgi:hypothetical protein